MDGRWAGEPYEASAQADDVMTWLPQSWNQASMPPCARCGSAFAAHVDDSKCPPAPSLAPPPRPGWPRRHPWLSGAILLAALLGGIGVGTVSVSHVNWASGNGQACAGYWQISNGGYLMLHPPAADGWRHLQAAEGGITDPALSVEVKGYDVDLFYADLPDALTAAPAIEASCNALGYVNPG
jgi:hypothetical protein